MRRFLLAAATLAALSLGSRGLAAFRSEIIPETAAKKHGLTRAWLNQITLDRGRARVRHVVLFQDMLYVQTDRAMVHAFDAETGQTMWQKQIGRCEHPSLRPGLHRDLLAVVNGSRLYVVNRYNGDLLYEKFIKGSPGGGPALSDRWAYVPCINGMMMAYRIEPLTDPLRELGKIKENMTAQERADAEEDRRQNIRLRQEVRTPLACRSVGRALITPVVVRQEKYEEYVVWPTDQGFLHMGKVSGSKQNEALTVKRRAQSDGEICAAPAFIPPDPAIDEKSGVIVAVSRDGNVQARLEKSGELFWQFPTGEPIIHPATVVEDAIYVTTQLGGLYCLDAKTGNSRWWAPHVAQFIAASKERIYGADKLGRIAVLRAETGARLDSFDAAALPIKLLNPETDRIYLATNTGLVQCLHEVELSKPLRHNEARRKLADEGQPAVRQQRIEQLQAPQPQPGGGADDDPFGGGGGGAGADPFGGGGGGGADPFGGGGAGGNGGGGAGGNGGGGAGGGDADPFAPPAGGAANDPFAGGGGDPFQ